MGISVNELKQTMRRVREALPYDQASPQERGPQSTELWWPFENHTGAAVPAYGIFNVVGTTSSTSSILYGYTKAAHGPNVSFAINEGLEVPVDGIGLCTMAWPARVLYDATEGTPAELELWGPVYNSYKLKKHTSGPGYFVLGDINTTDTTMLVARHTCPVFGATLRRAATQAITTATWTAISWDTVDADNADTRYYSGGAPTYLTIPFSGEYRVTLNVSFEHSGAGSYRSILLVDDNGAGADIRERSGHTSAPTAAVLTYTDTGRNMYSCTYEAYLSVGRRVYGYVAQNSGGNLNVGGIGAGDRNHTSLSIRFVGSGMI